MSDLRPLSRGTLHLVVDMQRVFAEETGWRVPEFDRLLGPIGRLCEAAPEATAFTRFIPPYTSAEAPGEWRRYFERWADLTRDRIDPALLEIAPALARFAPPCEVLDKRSYGGFDTPGFDLALRRHNVDTLLLSGVETDVCILSVALQAVDRGWRVVVVEDAVASSAPEGHRCALELFRMRFGCQIEIAPSEAVLGAWRQNLRARAAAG